MTEIKLKGLYLLPKPEDFLIPKKEPILCVGLIMPQAEILISQVERMKNLGIIVHLVEDRTEYIKEEPFQILIKAFPKFTMEQPLCDPDESIHSSYRPMHGKQGLLFRYDPKKVHDRIKPRKGFRKKMFNRKSFPKKR